MRKFLPNPFRRARVEQELHDELHFYVDALAEEKTRAGMPPEEALRAARIQFGGIEQVKEHVRDIRPGAWLGTLFQDLRYAARGLWNNPGFTAVVVLSLAIGIGANSALFSVLNAVLLRPLPVTHPEQLFALDNPLARSSVKDIFSWPLFERMRSVAGNKGIAASSRPLRTRVLADGDREPETDFVQLVSGEFFGLAGLSPALGRMIAPEDNSDPGRSVAVISHALWQRRFGGSAGVLGRGLILNGSHFTIVGVAPAGFTGIWLEAPVDMWIPLVMQPLVHYAQYFSSHDADEEKPWIHQEGIRWLNLIVRTRVHEPALASVFQQSIAQQADTIANAASRRLFLTQRLSLVPITQGFSRVRQQFAGPLFALMAMVAMVLLIACANTANLLLARANRRQREIAVRLALGAGRGRIIRQLLTESFLLASVAAAAGLAFSNVASELLVRGTLGATTGSAPFSTSIIDARVLGFTLALCAMTTLLFGLAPAFRATRVELEDALRAGARSLREGARINTRKLLVISQMALTLILAVAAIWFADSMRHLAQVRLGFDKDHVVTVWINPQSAGYANERLPELYRRLVESVEAIPGVRSAAIAMCGLASGCRNTSDVRIAGYEPRPGEQILVQENHIGLNYFATVGMRLLDGRDFTSRDTSRNARVAIVSEAFARRYFPAANAIGRRFAYTDASAKAGTEIVGIVEDARVNSARDEPPLMAYYSLQQGTVYGGSLEVRVTGDPAARMADIREAVRQVDRDLPVERITTLSEQVSGNLRQDRLIMWLTSTFGLLALGLGCFGLYGVMSYAVARRMGELGIRLALGAPESGLFRMVFGESLALIAAGLALGLPFVFALSRVVSGILFGVRVNDPVLVVLAALALTATGALTAFFPARRASRVSPMTALRYE